MSTIVPVRRLHFHDTTDRAFPDGAFRLEHGPRTGGASGVDEFRDLEGFQFTSVMTFSLLDRLERGSEAISYMNQHCFDRRTYR